MTLVKDAPLAGQAPEAAGTPVAACPMIGFGEVRHTRLRPAHHAFAYAGYFLLLPMRSMQDSAHAASRSCLARNRFAPLSFFDTDHGDGRGMDTGGALAWLDDLLRAQGITDATGEAWLQCYPRVLGYAFKPVSFWHCESRDGRLAAIVAEVNNTFGERHCYLLSDPSGAPLHQGQTLHADKVFHVSPFSEVSGSYRFRFMDTPTRTVARVEHHDESGPLLLTSLSGELRALTVRHCLRALLGYPLFTLGVIARIHWQALRLFVRRVPFQSKPAPPARFLTRGSP